MYKSPVMPAALWDIYVRVASESPCSASPSCMSCQWVTWSYETSMCDSPVIHSNLWDSLVWDDMPVRQSTLRDIQVLVAFDAPCPMRQLCVSRPSHTPFHKTVMYEPPIVLNVLWVICQWRWYRPSYETVMCEPPIVLNILWFISESTMVQALWESHVWVTNGISRPMRQLC